MKILPFKKIDAFASATSSGNPAAVVHLDTLEALSEAEMLRLAQELKGFVSEVGYAAPGQGGDLALRYWSSEREVPFCGHATIAIVHDWVATHPELHDRPTLTLQTQHTRLTVDNRYRQEGSVFISAPRPGHRDAKVGPKAVAAALGMAVADLDAAQPLAVVNGGLETLIVPIATLDAILAATPNLETLDCFCQNIGVDIVIVYCRQTAREQSNLRTRVFAPTFGYLEDPATGSGNAALGYHLLAQERWDGTPLLIEQNGLRASPNTVRLLAKSDEEGVMRVWFGGGAVVKIEGVYRLG